MSIATPNHTVQFSIRGLLIATAGVSCVFSGFSMYGVFGASSVALVLGLLLVVRGRRTKTTWITCAGVGLSIPSFCISGVMLAGWLLFDIGPIYSQVAWPHEFRRMVEIGRADTTDAKIVGLGSFIDSEYVWRLSLAPDRLDDVAAEFGFHTLPAENVPSSFWQAFPRWWRPSHDQNSRYLSTLNFPVQSRGSDGDHYFTMYDPQNEWLYVWYKFNF